MSDSARTRTRWSGGDLIPRVADSTGISPHDIEIQQFSSVVIVRPSRSLSSNKSDPRRSRNARTGPIDFEHKIIILQNAILILPDRKRVVRNPYTITPNGLWVDCNTKKQHARVRWISFTFSPSIDSSTFQVTTFGRAFFDRWREKSQYYYRQ